MCSLARAFTACIDYGSTSSPAGYVSMGVYGCIYAFIDKLPNLIRWPKYTYMFFIF